MIADYIGQIVEVIGHGVLAVDSEGRIVYWNRWMSDMTGIERAAAEGSAIYELYPGMRADAFRRNLKSVLAFGNFAFFSQKVHGWLLPIPAPPDAPPGYAHMQQNCRMGPIRIEGEVRYAFVIIEDVTEAVDNERKIADIAVRDVLTGVFNRRRFEERFGEEVRRAERYGRGLSLILLDIDHFKNVNDQLGHLFGDGALRVIAVRCGSVIRSTDVLCRYGGEEFGVILPETGIVHAVALAERLREVCCAEPVSCLGKERLITISLGTAEWSPGEAPSDLVSRADIALYAAKAQGRNRVETAE